MFRPYSLSWNVTEFKWAVFFVRENFFLSKNCYWTSNLWEWCIILVVLKDFAECIVKNQLLHYNMQMESKRCIMYFLKCTSDAFLCTCKKLYSWIDWFHGSCYYGACFSWVTEFIHSWVCVHNMWYSCLSKRKVLLKCISSVWWLFKKSSHFL